ncbi:MAG: pilus assembly protein PilM [Ignavibacteriales bacterium]|nr:pilus assembly protein PilM [Ignavibacteriales bacterium]
MKTTERYIAIIIEHQNITAVEIAHSPKGFTLTAAGSFFFQLDFDDHALFEQPGATQRERLFAHELSVFLKKIGSGSKHFSFALNSKMVMLQTIPVDSSLRENEIDQQAKWELNQYFLDSHPHSFSVNTQQLPRDPDALHVPTLVLAVRKSFVNFLTRVCAQSGTTLHIVDVDHFAAENAFLVNYPEEVTKRCMLIGADEESFDVSILVAGQAVNVSVVPRSSVADISQLVEYAAAAKPEAIYFHGRIVTPELVEEVSTATGVKAEILNPFLKVALPKSLGNYAEIQREQQSYAAAVGLALRTD